MDRWALLCEAAEQQASQATAAAPPPRTAVGETGGEAAPRSWCLALVLGGPLPTAPLGLWPSAQRQAAAPPSCHRLPPLRNHDPTLQGMTRA